MGHVLPGFFTLLFGFRWIVVILEMHFRSIGSRDRRRPFHSAASFPCSRCPGIPFEGIVKVAACSLGLVAETVTGFRGGKFVNWGNTQHMFMYFFFGLNGVIDILLQRSVPLPPGSDYASLLMALLIEILLFSFHLHGRTPLDVRLHQLLILTTAFTSVALLLESSRPKNVLLALARALGAFVHGTWFFQIGFILYNPWPHAQPWADADHHQMMLVTDIFVVHVVFSLIFAGLVWGFLWIRSRKERYRIVEDSEEAMLSLTSKGSKMDSDF